MQMAQKPNPIINSKKNLGFSLMSFVITSLLSLVVVAAFVQSLLTSNTNNKLSMELTRLTSTVDIASKEIGIALSYRGFGDCLSQSSQQLVTGFGAANPGPSTQVLSSTNFPITDVVSEALQGFEVPSGGNYVPTPTPLLAATLNELAIQPVQGSDVLVVHHTSSADTGLAQTPTDGTSPLQLASDNLPFEAGDFAFIGNCFQGSIFPVTGVSKAGGNTQLSYDSANVALPIFGADTRVRKAYLDIFYVGNTGRVNDAGNAIRALFRARNGQEAVEIAEGILVLQAQYSVLQGTDTFSYRAADDINLTTAQTKLVKISLLAASIQPVLDQADQQTYRLLNEMIPSGQHQSFSNPKSFKKVFTFSVAMFNGIK